VRDSPHRPSLPIEEEVEDHVDEVYTEAAKAEAEKERLISLTKCIRNPEAA
jgi:hypothetical protein